MGEAQIRGPAWGDGVLHSSQRVLLVDADPLRSKLLVASLERLPSTEFVLEADPHRALGRLRHEAFDAALVSWSLEPISGPDLCSLARAQGFDGVISLLGGRVREEDVVHALVVAGADDLMPLPVSGTVLAARLLAAGRRRQRKSAGPAAVVLRSGVQAELRVKQRTQPLSPVEERILQTLMASERPVAAEQLAPLGGDPPTPNLNALRVHIARLRAKLGPQSWRIMTVTGGYQFRRGD